MDVTHSDPIRSHSQVMSVVRGKGVVIEKGDWVNFVLTMGEGVKNLQNLSDIICEFAL